MKVWQLCFGGDAAKQGGGESAESCACTDGALKRCFLLYVSIGSLAIMLWLW